MKIKATKRAVYDLDINGETSRGWEESGHWNGFVELKKEHLTIIATRSESGFVDTLFANILGAGEDSEELFIVKASPSIIADIAEGQKRPPKPDAPKPNEPPNENTDT